MSCYFCNKKTHVSEYCRDFPTLRSRYTRILDRGQHACLCPKYEPLFLSKDNLMCKCKIICEVCFQHHHIAMCPKRDIEHPSNPILMPKPLCLFSHHSPFARRLFELSDRTTQFKLQKSCRFFRSQVVRRLKLKPDFDSEKSFEPNKVVYNRFGKFFDVKDVQILMLEKNCYFIFDSISLEKCNITKADLKFLSKSDPHTVLIKNCTLEHSVSLHAILEAFLYAYDITYISEETTEDWISDFLSVERKVNLRKITIADDNLTFSVNNLVMLLEQNKELIVTVVAQSCDKTTTLQQLESHQRFIVCEKKEDFDLCITLLYSNVKHCFRFQPF